MNVKKLLTNAVFAGLAFATPAGADWRWDGSKACTHVATCWR